MQKKYTMKHCLLITAYKNVDIINNLIDSVPAEWGIYIHLDKKSKIKISDINNRAHVFKTYSVKWGSRAHIKAILLLMKQVYKNDFVYDYYHLITGQDFICCPLNKVDETLGFDGFTYMEYFSIPNPNWTGPHGGYDIIQYYTLAPFVNFKNPKWRLLNIKFEKLQGILHLKKRLPKYPLYGGSTYGSFHKSAISELLSNPITKKLYRKLFLSVCGEELFFQTILMNSPLKDKLVNNNLRYIDWNANNPPKIVTEEDFDKIINSRALFCRKIDYQSDSLVLKLKEAICK